jgi:esterase/lipase superfamily enzyme
MAGVTVYFATNRAPSGAPDDWHSYGADIVAPSDPSQVTYAVAFVDGIDLNAEDSGQITGISNVQSSTFASGTTNDIVGSGKNVLIFIHGFANSFKHAITRAAYNREWFSESGTPDADTTVIAFTWPSLGQVVAAPPELLPDDYLQDQHKARQSGLHISAFLENLRPLLQEVRSHGRRAFLLAHSMGNYALQAAVESWFSHGKTAAVLFDEVLLAAADERYDTFGLPSPARLSDLHKLTSRTSIYYSIRDIAMYLSKSINVITRLGHEGPEHKNNPRRFSPSSYRIVDCTEVDDYDTVNPPDASHQYYRRSVTVRQDIALVMANDPAISGGLITL